MNIRIHSGRHSCRLISDLLIRILTCINHACSSHMSFTCGDLRQMSITSDREYTHAIDGVSSTYNFPFVPLTTRRHHNDRVQGNHRSSERSKRNGQPRTSPPQMSTSAHAVHQATPLNQGPQETKPTQLPDILKDGLKSGVPPGYSKCGSRSDCLQHNQASSCY